MPAYLLQFLSKKKHPEIPGAFFTSFAKHKLQFAFRRINAVGWSGYWINVLRDMDLKNGTWFLL